MIKPVSSSKFEFRLNPNRQKRDYHCPALKSDSFEKNPDISFTGMPKKVKEAIFSPEIKEFLLKQKDTILAESDVLKKADRTLEFWQEAEKVLFEETGIDELCKKENANKMVGVFRHELVNSVIYAHNTAEIVKNSDVIEVTPKEFDRYVHLTFNEISSSLDRFGVLFEKGFDFENGVDNIKIRPHQVFDMAFDSIKNKAELKDIKLKVEGKEILNQYKSGTEERRYSPIPNYDLYTVFSNVLMNAQKYSPKGSTITTSFEKQQVNNLKYLVFSVQDEGIGFEPSEIKALLSGDMTRGSNAIKSGISGTGFGLKAIAKILKFNGSYIEVKSPINLQNKDFPGSKVSCFIKLFNE